MSFGKRLREGRKIKNVSQQELAHMLGISINSVANYERGTSFPKEDYLYKIINILGMDPNYLFQDEMRADAGNWVEERLLIENYRAMDKRGRVFVSRLAEREIERKLKGRISLHDIKEKLFYLNVREGICGTLSTANEKDKMKSIALSKKADYVIMIKGSGAEPVFNDGNIISMKYAPDISDNQMGLFEVDGYTVLAVRKKGKLYSILGERINPTSNDLKTELYGRVIEIYRESK